MSDRMLVVGSDISSRRSEVLNSAGAALGLNRVPCPEAAVRQLMDGAERASGKQLGWAALLLVQLLCWMRADSCARFQDNDIVVSQDGRVSVSVRYMKNRIGV